MCAMLLAKVDLLTDWKLLRAREGLCFVIILSNLFILPLPFLFQENELSEEKSFLRR